MTRKQAIGIKKAQFRRLSRSIIGVLMLLATAGSGCSEKLPPGPERSVVSGTVSLAGNPIPFGTISFVPVEGAALPVSGAEIRDGKYEVSQNGGVPVGKHRVEINGWNSPPSQLGAADVQSEVKPLVPEKYNAKSELLLSIESAAPMKKDFDLK